MITVSPLFKTDKPHFHDRAGNLAIGFGIYTYLAGTDTPKSMYSDPSGSVQYSNPIVLNSNGEPDGQGIYADVTHRYKIVLKDTLGAVLWSMDDVSPMGVGNITIEGNYSTKGSWDRSLQIDNDSNTISGDMQCVAIRQRINNDPSTFKYAKVCEADINTVTWINEWITTLQLGFQCSGAYYEGKSTGIFSLNMENYIQSSQSYVQKHEEDGKWLLWDGDNKSPGLAKLYLYWRDDSSSQHYELWCETDNLKYYETIVAQAVMNCSMRNHLTSGLALDQERNIWRFDEKGISTLTNSLPVDMTLVGSWEPSSASIKPQEDHGVFYVEYGTTTFADAEAAYLAGKTLVCRQIRTTIQQTRTDDLYFLIGYLPIAGTYTGNFVFSSITSNVQTRVLLKPSATYEKMNTFMATRTGVMDTLTAEIAPDYSTVVQECYDNDSFPIPVGTYVTANINNTSLSVLQYLYRSKVEINRSEADSSGPDTAPQKWDKIHVADELGNHVADTDIHVTTSDKSAWNAKADKVTGATSGNLAGLDANGNLTDSGMKAEDFALDTPTFSQASTRSNLNGSGESMATILGKIKKWFADLGTAAFKTLVTSWSNSISNDNIPSEKLVKDSLDGKVDKVSGKGLSTNDYTTTEKTKLNGIYAGATKVESSSIGKIKINGTDTTVYTHPASAGNKHVPSGGSSNQYLRYSSDGTAAWAYPYANTTDTWAMVRFRSFSSATTVNLYNDYRADQYKNSILLIRNTSSSATVTVKYNDTSSTTIPAGSAKLFVQVASNYWRFFAFA